MATVRDVLDIRLKKNPGLCDCEKCQLTYSHLPDEMALDEIALTISRVLHAYALSEGGTLAIMQAALAVYLNLLKGENVTAH